MLNVVKSGSTIVDRIIDLLAICAGLLLVGIMLLISTDVTMRYIFNSPIKDVLEIGEHGLVFLTFLPAAWVLKKDRHVRMEGVLAQFGQRNQRIINIVTSLMAAFICLVLFYYGLQGTWEYYEKGLWFPGGLRIPQYPILSVLVVSYFLLFIQFLRRSYAFLREVPTGKEAPPSIIKT